MWGWGCTLPATISPSVFLVEGSVGCGGLTIEIVPLYIYIYINALHKKYGRRYSIYRRYI